MRVVWAVSFLNQKWTELQYKMLICSVQSWKQYNPTSTTVLYGSLGLLRNLKKLGKLDLWDEVYEDLESYLSGCFTEASWDYPKVEALYREKEKVLYVDYDILFQEEVETDLSARSEYNWFWCEESTNFEYYYTKSEKIEGLPLRLQKKIFHSEIAYNTGMMYVDRKYLELWRNTYREVFPSASRYVGTSKSTKFSLTVGQSNIVGIVPRESVRFITDLHKNINHSIGWFKRDSSCLLYSETLDIYKSLYPDPEFDKKFKLLRVV